MSDASPAPGGRPVAPWTVRVAGFSARHRWPVLVLWLVATIGLFWVSLAIGGTDAAAAVTNEQRSRYEAGEAGRVRGRGNENAASTREARESNVRA